LKSSDKYGMPKKDRKMMKNFRRLFEGYWERSEDLEKALMRIKDSLS